MSLDDIIDVQIAADSRTPTRVGFGTPLVAAFHEFFPERVRLYRDAGDMLQDGFPSTHPAFLAVRAAFAQTPAPTVVKVGRRAGGPTQSIRLLVAQPTAVGEVYSGTIRGTPIELVVADTTTSAADVAASLATQVNAIAGLTAAAVADAGALDVIADAPGDWSEFRALSRNLGIQDQTAEPLITLESDLQAMRNEDDDWFGLVVADAQSKLQIEAVAAFAESAGKLYFAQTADQEVLDPTVDDDILSTLQASSFFRTVPLFAKASHGQFADAAWAGRGLPTDPGSITWMFKTLAGVAFDNLTAAEKALVLRKGGNVYTPRRGIAITEQGRVAAGEFIDVIRGRDWLVARIQERIFGVQTSTDKIPFTDPGIGQIEAELRAQLSIAVTRDVLAADPEPVVTVPTAASVSPADKRERTLPRVTFQATLAGAIHAVQIRGRVTP